MFSTFYSPNIVSIGSSEKGENSYSHHAETKKLGVAVIDRFTYSTLEFVENVRDRLIHSDSRGLREITLLDWFQSFTKSSLGSHVGWNSTLARPLDQVPFMDFFGGKLQLELNIPSYPLTSLDEYKGSERASTFTETYFNLEL